MDKVLIADHHPITRKGITSILNTEENYEVIHSISDGNDLLKVLTKTEVDILILEIDIPNLNSITAIKAIKIKYGAAGYVSKTASIQRVLDAVNQIQRGGIYLNETLSKRLISDGNTTQGLAYKYMKLSSREIEVLNLLSNGKRNKEIAANLNINEKTVSTYKMRLLKKLEAQNVAELIKHARLLQNTTSI